MIDKKRHQRTFILTKVRLGCSHPFRLLLQTPLHWNAFFFTAQLVFYPRRLLSLTSYQVLPGTLHTYFSVASHTFCLQTL